MRARGRDLMPETIPMSGNLPRVILLFKIRDASGERKYLITASNLTELTFSKNVLLKCSFNSFYQEPMGSWFYTVL